MGYTQQPVSYRLFNDLSEEASVEFAQLVYRSADGEVDIHLESEPVSDAFTMNAVAFRKAGLELRDSVQLNRQARAFDIGNNDGGPEHTITWDEDANTATVTLASGETKVFRPWTLISGAVALSDAGV